MEERISEGSKMATEKRKQLNRNIKEKGTRVLNSERQYNVIWGEMGGVGVLDITTKGVSSLVPNNTKKNFNWMITFLKNC